MANLSNINNKFLVTTGGNVGIGITGPGQKLTVQGSSTAAAGRFTAGGNTNTLELFGSSTTGQSSGLLVNAGTNTADYSARFRNAAGSVIMNIRGDGNVGIGTTSPDILGYGNTSRVLAVQGIIGTASAQRPVVLNLAGQRDDGSDGFVSDLNFLNMASNGTTVNSRAIMRMAREGADNSNQLGFFTANAGSTTQKMVISSAGVVTVGASKRYVDSASTQFDLEVTEGMAFGGAAFTYATIQGDSAGHGNIEICANAYPANTGAESKITFKTSTTSGGQYTNALVVKGPYVGIGEDSPDAPLHIKHNSDTSSDFLIIEDSDSTAGSVVPKITFRSTTSTIGGIRGHDVRGLQLGGGTNIQDLNINPSGYVGINRTSNLGTYTKLGIQFGTGGNAANIDESVNYSCIEMYPLRTGSTYGLFTGAMGLTSAYMQVASDSSPGRSAGSIGLNPWGGNVGIGTTSPASEANLSLAANSVAEGGHLVLFKGTSQAQATHLDNYANTFRIMNGADASSGAVQFSINHSTSAATFAGNVGIGGSPTGITNSGPGGNATLDVQGPLRNKRVMRGWYHCGPITSSNAYRHIKTNLWMGGSPAGNTEYIMGGFEAKGFHYYGSYPGFGHGTCMFHNWSGSFASLQVANYGTAGFMQSPYVSSDGYCVLVLRANTYMQPVIDFSQYYTPYPWRTAYVTAETTSNNLTGVY